MKPVTGLNFVLANASKFIGQPTLEDPMVILAGQAKDLGLDVACNGGAGMKAMQYEARWLPRPWVNLIFDGFNVDWIIPEMKRARSNGINIVTIQTEEPGYFGFNNSGPTGMWATRQKAFIQACAEGCFDGVLYFVPQGGKFFKSHHPNSAHVETGYSRSNDNPNTGPREIDFVFAGGVNERRDLVCKRLAEKYIVSRQTPNKWGLLPRHQRDILIRNAKVALQIKPFSISRIISGSRCAWALMNGVPIISELTKSEGSEWPEVIEMASSYDGFYANAIDMLNHYQESWIRQHARFKRIMSPERQLARALRELGIMGTPRSRPALLRATG